MASDRLAVQQAPAETAGKASWRLSRPLLIALGWTFVALGFVGIFLPLLPTTPFVLLALWCFARSSKRFHDWLYNHPRFGPLARNWREYGVVPLRAKLLAVTTMALSLGYLIHAGMDWHILAVVGATLTVVATWLVSRPSRPPASDSLL